MHRSWEELLIRKSSKRLVDYTNSWQIIQYQSFCIKDLLILSDWLTFKINNSHGQFDGIHVQHSKDSETWSRCLTSSTSMDLGVDRVELAGHNQMIIFKNVSTFHNVQHYKCSTTHKTKILPDFLYSSFYYYHKLKFSHWLSVQKIWTYNLPKSWLP